MHNLAVSFFEVGRHAESLQLREETLALRRARLGPDHPDTLKSMFHLAISVAVLGRVAEALRLHEETLTLRKAKLGRDHPDTLTSMVRLANSFAASGQTQKALQLLQELLPLHDRKLGADHTETLETTNHLAWLLATATDDKLRDPARAVELAALVAEKSPRSAMYRNNLGTARYRAGDWKGAIADLGKAIDLRKGDDPTNCYSGFFLAMAYWQLGEKDKAREWFDKSAAWMDKGRMDDAELKRFRAEAAEMLGISVQP